MGLFQNSLVYDLHLELPALNLSILDDGILKRVQHGSLLMFSLTMADYLPCTSSHCPPGQVEGTILSKFYSFGLAEGPLLHA